MRRKILLILIIISWLNYALAGQGTDPDFMRSIGKMYVVVSVLLVIFVILIIYLVYVDRKVRKLEKLILHEKEDQ